MSGNFHFTKNTVEATYWCKRCAKPTLHRVDHGRRGPCLVCMEKLEAEAAERPQTEPASQANLFAEEK